MPLFLIVFGYSNMLYYFISCFSNVKIVTNIILFYGVWSGVIHYHEFVAAALNLQEITETNMKLAFDKLSHHHEFITCSDIHQLLGKCF